MRHIPGINTNADRSPRTSGLLRILLPILLLLSSPGLIAEWVINPAIKDARGIETKAAYTLNEAGYSLEIYRDSGAVIRGRFTLRNGLLQLAEDHCPTYQIDRGTPTNQSISGELCLSSDAWSEYILGYIRNNEVVSSPLLATMNGITITFRFRLQNGDHRETRFSLQGTKRILSTVIGENVIVRAR